MILLKHPVKCFVFLILPVFLVVLPAGLLFMCIDKSPAVPEHSTLHFDDIKRVKQIIKTNKPGQLYLRRKKALVLTQNDIDLLLAYGISHGLGFRSLSGEARVLDDKFIARFSLKLPGRLSGHFINFAVQFEKSDRLAVFSDVHIGKIKLPGVVVQPLVEVLHRFLLNSRMYRDLWQHSQLVEHVIFKKNLLTVIYRLNYRSLEALKDTGRSFFMTEKQQQLWIAYYNHLADLTHTYRLQEQALFLIVKDLFAYAGGRTQEGNDPVLENTAAIQVLSLLVLKQPLHRVVDKKLRAGVKPTARTRLTLLNRTDLPKHFFVSAALTVSAGSKFANLIGITKEVEDADRGTGFSFADLAADRAGVRFAQMAVASKKAAAAFQKSVMEMTHPSDFMPAIDRLPEGIMELEFKRRYTDLDSEAYRLIDSEIDRRLNTCRLYQQ